MMATRSRFGNVANFANASYKCFSVKFKPDSSSQRCRKMSVSSYDAVAEKVLFDLELAIKKNVNLNEFYIIPTSEEENKNSSPILKGENTLGLESWIITHIYPYAHNQIMQKNNYRTQNLCKVIPCLTGVALLNPEMPTVWNRRRELIISKKLHVDDELRLTRMALSRKPKCNDALTHRRWIISETLKDVQDKSSLLAEELKLSEIIANRYHSNYHAWSHRMWSLQHLLPDSPFHNMKKKGQKNALFEFVSSDLSVLITRAITRSEYSYITNCEISRMYFEELENNFRWISSHVSDHSGLHFRKFLIVEILSFVKNFLSLSGKMEYQTEIDYVYSNAQCSLISSIFSNGKMNVTEFLTSFDFANHYKRAINDYLMNLEQELTLFDVALFLIVTELKSNYSLCLIFLGHEALWCYRRFLIYLYRQLIDALDYCKTNSELRIFVHQDKNGVPYRKDFKYDHMGDSVQNSKHSDLFLALYTRLLKNEEEIISKMNPPDDHAKNILRGYSHWLRHCFTIEDKVL